MRGMRTVPRHRVTSCNGAPVRPDGDFVLYWMIATRRADWSFALDRAVEHATELRRPLLILEALRCDHAWASDRVHRFVLDGMADNARRIGRTAALYHPFVERARGEGRGLVEALAARACVVVTDDVPFFFFPRMVAEAASRIGVRLEKVDSLGLLPFRAATVAFPSAYAFRRFLQKSLRPHLEDFPSASPLEGARIPRMGALPREVVARWPAADQDLLASSPAAIARLPIDHGVPPSPLRGGPGAASARLREFLDERLPRYAEDRSHPDRDGGSGLSPYLHFGHLSPHAILAQLALREGWSTADLSESAAGKRTGWWGMSASAEAFLEQLVTWRELGANFCALRADHFAYASLPPWAARTLAEHATDPRPVLYDRRRLEEAATHDEVWNAGQTQLRRDGVLHNYVRMLWGKKILEWSASPEEALDVMIDLNNRWALDGRDANSYSGIFWVLGRYDRPFPDRPVLGTLRPMSSKNTVRKLDLGEYLRRFGPRHPGELPRSGPGTVC
jgi:deoxyribodipyrimidine photo-lyase